jgi:hypothetical protein
MNYHPLAVAAGVGAVFAVPLVAYMFVGGSDLGSGAILVLGGMALFLIGMFVLIVLWVVETIRARR